MRRDAFPETGRWPSSGGRLDARRKYSRRATTHLAALGVATGLLASACGGGGSVEREARVGAAACTPAAGAPPAPGGGSRAQAATGAPQFCGSVAVIDAATRVRVMSSWRPECPVAIEDLRLITVDHWGLDGALRRGELVVHEEQAEAALWVFQALFEVRFPIERMELVDVYGADDERSMAANNSSAFNCRTVAGSNVWSEHAYGRAIDINPVQNPSLGSDGVTPPAGAAYVDRTRRAPGMIHADDAVVRAFATIGWTWGGSWTSRKDYQHFSATGR